MARSINSETKWLHTAKFLPFLNLSLFEMLTNNADKNTIYDLIDRSVEILQQKRIPKSERWLAQWTLGLTDKAFQNILRDDSLGLNSYKKMYVDSCEEVIRIFEDKHGSLSCVVKYGKNTKALLGWSLIAYLLNTIGAETLTIRGSAKSAYGKLFEKLVLGSLLHILGFKFVSSHEVDEWKKIFWLSSRGERRESDATLIYGAGKGVRFDIGFIGRGNPEISLDKVSRFEREVVLGRSNWYMATIILVDRIGERSRIETLAQNIGGSIIQMSMGYWPQEVARVLQDVLGHRHNLATMNHSKIGTFLAREIKKVPIEKFIGLEAK